MTATTRPQVETVRAVSGEVIGSELHSNVIDITDLFTDEATVDPLVRPALAHRRSV